MRSCLDNAKPWNIKRFLLVPFRIQTRMFMESDETEFDTHLHSWLGLPHPSQRKAWGFSRIVPPWPIRQPQRFHVSNRIPSIFLPENCTRDHLVMRVGCTAPQYLHPFAVLVSFSHHYCASVIIYSLAHLRNVHLIQLTRHIFDCALQKTRTLFGREG